MPTAKSTDVEEIITALEQLGGEAQAVDIKDRVTQNRGGIPPQYSRSHSYRETIQRIIENHCPESADYQSGKYTARFRRVMRGRYRLI